MKRITTVLTMTLILLLMTLFLASCGDNQADNQANNQAGATEIDEHEPLRIIAVAFPQYDFIRQIAGDRVELSMLLSPGAEPHGFEPTPRDMIAINNADLLVYVGGHGDEWVHSVLASLDRQNMRTVALLDMVDAVLQELVEGMEHGHAHHHGHSHDHHHHHDDHDHDNHDNHHHDHDNHHDHHDDHDHDDHDDHHHDHDDHDHDDNHHDHDHHHDHHHHEDEYDEHVWTSPRNAILIVQALTDILAEMDPDNAEYFRGNAAAYIVQLQELDAAFVEVVASGLRRTVVFGDRFPFRYLMDAYGLTYFAAFTGCSAETQASPATIAFLINKVQEEDIPVVFHIEFSNLLIANTIVEATGARLVELHSAHNVSHADFNAGVTYLDLMWRNVDSLREGLN